MATIRMRLFTWHLASRRSRERGRATSWCRPPSICRRGRSRRASRPRRPRRGPRRGRCWRRAAASCRSNLAQLGGRAGVALTGALEPVVRRVVDGAEDAEHQEPRRADASRDVRIGPQVLPPARCGGRRLGRRLLAEVRLVRRVDGREGHGRCRRRRARVEVDGLLLAGGEGQRLTAHRLAAGLDDDLHAPWILRQWPGPRVTEDGLASDGDPRVVGGVVDPDGDQGDLRLERGALVRRRLRRLRVARLLLREQPGVVDCRSVLGVRLGAPSHLAQTSRDEDARVRARDDPHDSLASSSARANCLRAKRSCAFEK